LIPDVLMNDMSALSSIAGYGDGLIASTPNQFSRVVTAPGDRSWVNRMASRFWGLEQAT